MRAHVLTAERPARAGETLDDWDYSGNHSTRVADGTEQKVWQVFPIWGHEFFPAMVEVLQDQACRYLECELAEITWHCAPTLHEAGR